MSFFSPEPEIEPDYEPLVRRHRAAFERLARRLAGNAEDAEDLLQESLLDAYRSFHRFRSGTSFYAWVARIMSNNHLDRARRRRCATVPIEQEALEMAADPAADPEETILGGQLEAPFDTALAALQPAQRATVMLCDLDGATYEEAARAEACPVGTIRSRLHRAHRYLRDLLAHVAPAFQAGTAEPALPIHSRRAFLRMGTAAVAGAAIGGLAAEPARGGERVRVRACGGSTGSRALQAFVAAASADDRLEVDATDAPLTPGALLDVDLLLLAGEPAGLDAAALRRIARRVRDGRMGLIVLGPGRHSNLLAAVLGPGRLGDGPDLRADALDLRITAPRHPIAAGVEGFRLRDAATADGTADSPPDMVLCAGTTSGGQECGWQGMAWTPGQGRVFCFLPDGAAGPDGDAALRRLLLNAARWCSGLTATDRSGPDTAPAAT